MFKNWWARQKMRVRADLVLHTKLLPENTVFSMALVGTWLRTDAGRQKAVDSCERLLRRNSRNIERVKRIIARKPAFYKRVTPDDLEKAVQAGHLRRVV
jgi:hypothetical protein